MNPLGILLALLGSSDDFGSRPELGENGDHDLRGDAEVSKSGLDISSLDLERKREGKRRNQLDDSPQVLEGRRTHSLLVGDLPDQDLDDLNLLETRKSLVEDRLKLSESGSSNESAEV